MKFFRISEVPREKHIAPLFTGPDLTRQHIALGSKELRMGIVNFGKGTRNKFHAHSVDQLLIVTAGKGYVVTENEKKPVTAGDIICIPAGEKHWHGAAEDSEFSHIVVTVAAEGGHKTTQFEN
jgi:quercetin dioxygenase-like cupin family protein